MTQLKARRSCPFLKKIKPLHEHSVKVGHSNEERGGGKYLLE
jgi:hypothetical protein